MPTANTLTFSKRIVGNGVRRVVPRRTAGGAKAFARSWRLASTLLPCGCAAKRPGSDGPMVAPGWSPTRTGVAVAWHGMANVVQLQTTPCPFYSVQRREDGCYGRCNAPLLHTSTAVCCAPKPRLSPPLLLLRHTMSHRRLLRLRHTVPQARRCAGRPRTMLRRWYVAITQCLALPFRGLMHEGVVAVAVAVAVATAVATVVAAMGVRGDPSGSLCTRPPCAATVSGILSLVLCFAPFAPHPVHPVQPPPPPSQMGGRAGSTGSALLAKNWSAEKSAWRLQRLWRTRTP